jgi:O-antigen/teichoic acid export membrane protein
VSPASSAVSNSLGWLVPLLAYYLALPVIVNAIGAEKFGLIVFAMTLVGYVGVVNPPVSAGNIRFLAVAYGRGDRDVFIASALSGAVLSVSLAVAAGAILFAFAPFVASRVFNSSPALQAEALSVLWLGCAGFVVSSLIGAGTAIPAALQRYGLINLCTSGGAALGLLLGAWRAVHAKSAVAVVNGQIAGNLLALSVLVLFNARILRAMGVTLQVARHQWRSGMRELFSFSATLWLSQVCSTVALQTDKFIVGLMSGSAALAWYSIPAKMGEQLATAVGRVSLALYPLAGSFSGRDERSSLVALYNAFLRLNLILSVIAVVIAETHGSLFLQLWLRAKLPDSAGPILIIAMLTALFRTPGTVAYHVSNGMGRAGITLLAGVVGAASSAVLVYVGAVFNGPVGAATGFLASAILTNLAFDGLVRIRLLGGSAGQWADPYLRTLLTLLAVAPAARVLAAVAGDSLGILVAKACAAVALSGAVGFCSGLLKVADIRLLLQKQERVEAFTRGKFESHHGLKHMEVA